MIKRTLSVIAMVTIMGNAGSVAADDSKLLQDLMAGYKLLRSQVQTLKTEVGVLQAEVEAKQDAMDCLSQVGSDLYVDACNFHVRNGTGSSNADSTPNGLGNLIVGYNEEYVGGYNIDFPDGYEDGSEKTGSHNVIVGPYHTYTNYNGLVTGKSNAITGENTTVTGGWANIASGSGSSVSGGAGNTASGSYSTVSGGSANEASALGATVSGGHGSEATGQSATVSGGAANTASGYASSVTGSAYVVADGSFEALP